MITARRVDIRYATALLQTAKERGLEKVVYNDMVELRMLTLNSNDFRNFLRNPAIKPSQKGHIAQTLFKDVFHQLTLDFLLLIIKKSRVGNIQNIATAYVQLYRKDYHLMTVTVYTSKELVHEQKQDLLAVLNKQIPNQTVELRNRIYPKMIGGLVLRYEDYLYDGSIATQLKKFRNKFEFNLHESQL